MTTCNIIAWLAVVVLGTFVRADDSGAPKGAPSIPSRVSGTASEVRVEGAALPGPPARQPRWGGLAVPEGHLDRVSLAHAVKTDVFVVGTLYRRHDIVPTYDLAAVRRIVLAIKPDVLVIDCTPQEVRDRRVHESKIEYAQVILPLIQEGRYKVYAAEPDEPLFTEIVSDGSRRRETFQQTKPQEFAAVQDYAKATYAALATYWRSPADVHDALTAQVLASKVALDSHLTGTADLSTGWNRHWTDTILRAVRENPGARVLALTGIENRAWIVDALRQSPDIALVDMPRWLRANLSR